MSLERQARVRGGHARAVVPDENARDPAALEVHLDAGGARVERVLDELLDDGGGPLDDFAGGDPIDDAALKAGGSSSARQSIREVAPISCLENTIFPPTTVASTFVSTI